MTFSHSRLGITALGLAAIALITGCSSQSDPEPTGLFVVEDSFIRVAGDSCNGSGNMGFIHKNAEITVTDDAGTVLVDATLPSGYAVQSDGVDYGDLERVPTRCEFGLDTSKLELGTAYSVAIDGKDIGRSTFRTRDGQQLLSYPDAVNLSATLGDQQ